MVGLAQPGYFKALMLIMLLTLPLARCGGKSERDKAAEWDRFIDFIKKDKWDR
jgi:hypothetical protein